MPAQEYTQVTKGFFKKPFDGVIRIEIIEGNDALWVDGREDPPAVSASSPKGVDKRFSLWRVAEKDFRILMSSGIRKLPAAYVSGRLKISGDMSIMSRLEE